MKTNDCIAKAIEPEIKKSFIPEVQEEMLLVLRQMRGATNKAYDLIYASNKYCFGSCGLIAGLYAPGKERELLQQILEDLLFLNLSKGDGIS